VARTVVISICAAIVVCGCGSSGGSGSSSTVGKGDEATFTIDGRTIDVRQSGTAKVEQSAAPQLDYSGPLGCRGRYFDTKFSDGVRLLFRYGSDDAYLLVGSDLYYLGGVPRRVGRRLAFDTTVGPHRISIRVACPPPPRTGPL
jgi:hypothetical protein